MSSDKVKCPFKYKTIRQKEGVYDEENFPEYENYMSCKIMNTQYDECVGESKCPIMRK